MPLTPDALRSSLCLYTLCDCARMVLRAVPPQYMWAKDFGRNRSGCVDPVSADSSEHGSAQGTIVERQSTNRGMILRWFRGAQLLQNCRRLGGAGKSNAKLGRCKVYFAEVVR